MEQQTGCKSGIKTPDMKDYEKFFKKIRDTKGRFHAKMGSIKDRNGMDLTEAEDNKMRWQEYTEFPITSRCSRQFQKRQRNQRSNCQHPLDHGKSKRVPEKHLFLLY